MRENMVPFDKEEVTAGAGAAVGLNAQKILNMRGAENHYAAEVLVTTYPIAWQQTGATATGSDKNVANVNDIILLDSLLAIDNFSAIGVGGSAVLAVTYYRAC